MCEHRDTVIHTTGSVRFVGGDIVDDIEEHEVCLDCGTDLSEIVSWEGENGLEFYARDILGAVVTELDDEGAVYDECPF